MEELIEPKNDISSKIIQEPMHGIYYTEIAYEIKKESECEIIWDIYRNSIQKSAEPSKDKVNSFYSLKETLLDKEFVKFILWKDRSIIGFLIATNNLKKAEKYYIDL